MFEAYRIKKLQPKVDAQRKKVDLLDVAERNYENSYYTDKFHNEFCKLLQMQSKLKWLQDRVKY